MSDLSQWSVRNRALRSEVEGSLGRSLRPIKPTYRRACCPVSYHWRILLFLALSVLLFSSSSSSSSSTPTRLSLPLARHGLPPPARSLSLSLSPPSLSLPLAPSRSPTVFRSVDPCGVANSPRPRFLRSSPFLLPLLQGSSSVGRRPSLGGRSGNVGARRGAGEATKGVHDGPR